MRPDAYKGLVSSATKLLRRAFEEMCDNGWRIEYVPLFGERRTELEQPRSRA